MLHEEKKRMNQNNQAVSSRLMEIHHENMLKTEKCSIIGRNHASAYIDDSDQSVFYGLYWLDVNKSSQKDLEAELIHIIPLMTRFDDAKQCEEAIKTAVGCTIVLVIASSMAHASLPLLHDLTNVTKIFIHTSDGNRVDLQIIMEKYDKVSYIK